MKKLNLILLLTLFTGYNGYTQISWEKLFSKPSTDAFRSIQEVPAGGYIAAGYTSNFSSNDSDAFAVRLNSSGDTLWTFTYNGGLSQKDLFYKVIVTSDGGFAFCGYTTSLGSADDLLYMKLNSSGQLQWVKTLGGTGREHGQDIIETSDGFTIAAYTTSAPAQYYDAMIIHTDLNGDPIWTKVIGDSDYDDANTIKQLPDGGYILGGQSMNGTNGFDQFLIRTNSSGDTIWTKKFGTTQTDNIECLTVVAGGYVLVGSTNTANTGDDGYLVKTDTSGTVQWTNVFGGSDQDDFHRVEKTTDGGYILSGTERSYGDSLPNMWLMKTNAQGDSMWAMTFGGDNHDHGYSAIETSDGGYIIAGYSGSFGFNNEDGYIVKIGADGTVENHLTYITAYALISPTCSGSASHVTVVYKNFGNEPVSNIPVTVEISGGITQTLDTIVNGTMDPAVWDTLTFSAPVNTTGGGTFTFYGYTGIANDVYPQNNSFTLTTTLLPCTGIEDIPSRLGFAIYPNPSRDNITIDFSEQYSKAEIELINCIGASVKRLSLNDTYGQKKILDLESLSKGFYLLKVYADGNLDVRRLVID